MKLIAISALMVLLFLPALASEDGVIVGPSTDDEFEFVPANRDLIDIAGTVTVELRGDGGEGVPNGPVLGSATYQEMPPRGWQGQNLDNAVPLTAGAQYWLVYSVVVGALVSSSDAGTIIPHYWNNDCATGWSGPWNSLPWMARFYGYDTTATDLGSWSTIKALY
jgi:hypothetical protein